MSVRFDIAMAKYLTLVEDADAHVRVARKHPHYVGCPETCHECCNAAAVLPIGLVEVEWMLDALEAFPESLREFILDKARRAVARLEAHGLDAERIMRDALDAASRVLENTPEAPCPLLVGGVCSVYPQRPLICRVWGCAVYTGRDVSVCPKTYVRRPTSPDDAVPYYDLWRKVRALNASLGQEEKEPMAFLLLRKWEERRSKKSQAEP